MASWKSLIEYEMKRHKDSFEFVVYSSLSESELQRNFDNGYGIAEGIPFLLWTSTRVYFPVQYDGSEWVDSVPRHPCKEVMYHVGGG